MICQVISKNTDTTLKINQKIVVLRFTHHSTFFFISFFLSVPLSTLALVVPI